MDPQVEFPHWQRETTPQLAPVASNILSKHLKVGEEHSVIDDTVTTMEIFLEKYLHTIDHNSSDITHAPTSFRGRDGNKAHHRFGRYFELWLA